MTFELVSYVLSVAFCIFGIASIIAGIFQKKKSEVSYKSALRTEGTIVDLGFSQPRPFVKRRFSPPAYTCITVEFVTHTNEKIRSDADNNFAVFYSGQYAKGDKVELLYNPENPSEFVISNTQSADSARIILIALGIMLLIMGISFFTLKLFFLQRILTK